MPLYEYECNSCGYRFEKLQRVSDAPSERECPECGGNARRKIGAPALQFKGSGWYVTDYGKGKTNGTPERKTTPAKDESTSSSSSDSSSSSSSSGNTESAKASTKATATASAA